MKARPNSVLDAEQKYFRNAHGHNELERAMTMSRIAIAVLAAVIAATLIGGLGFVAPATAAAMTAAEKAAQKKATADCKAQVREKAKYQEMSWYARRRAVKNCVKETLAAHH